MDPNNARWQGVRVNIKKKSKFDNIDTRQESKARV